MTTLVAVERPGTRPGQANLHTARQTFVVNLEHGLHARPCALLIKTLRPFQSQVTVEANGERASGHSIMGLMALAAGCGAPITFTATGADALQALAAIRHLFDTHFAEAYRSSAPAEQVPAASRAE